MKHRRVIKMILPRLQLRLIVAFLCLFALSLVLQYILILNALAGVASELPHDGLLLLDEVPAMLTRILVISAGVLMPLTFFIGLLATHRFAGPLYRFHVYLREVIAGGKPADCKLRNGDELQELCSLINQATATVRATDTAKHEELPSPRQELRAAG